MNSYSDRCSFDFKSLNIDEDHKMSSFSDQELRGQMEELRAKISATEVVLRHYSSPASEGERLAQRQLLGEDRSLDIYLDLGKDRLQQLFIDLQKQLAAKEEQLGEKEKQRTRKSLGACCVRA